MKKLFDYKYRLYFRTPFQGFSQCKEVVYTDNIEKINNKIDNVEPEKGYVEYLLIIQTENGPIVERNPLERPLVKKLKRNGE